jgi:hypothetical protein
MGGAASSYATAGIALRVSGALKPHQHNKVETPSVGYSGNTWLKFVQAYLNLRYDLLQYTTPEALLFKKDQPMLLVYYFRTYF